MISSVCFSDTAMLYTFCPGVDVKAELLAAISWT